MTTDTSLLIATLFNSASDSAEIASRAREAQGLTELNGALRTSKKMMANKLSEAESELEDSQDNEARLRRQLRAANAALEAANETCREWQATMGAWMDFAIVLRDEIKDCPNDDAHHFGKNKEARVKFLQDLEDKKRVELGIKPRVRI